MGIKIKIVDNAQKSGILDTDGKTLIGDIRTLEKFSTLHQRRTLELAALTCSDMLESYRGTKNADVAESICNNLMVEIRRLK